MKPRCNLEKLALAITHFHSSKAPFTSSSVMGGEFWVQVRTSGDELSEQSISFHWDKDEKLLSLRDEWKHPDLATVTYLGQDGAPTVIFNSRVADDGTVLDSGTETANQIKRNGPEWTFVSYPRAAKHTAFAGDLLHGCPQMLVSLPPTSKKKRRTERNNCISGVCRSWERVTILVNIWRSYRPLGIKRLNRKLSKKLSENEVWRPHIHSPMHSHSIHQASKRPREDLLLADGRNLELTALPEHRAPLTAPVPVADLKEIGADTRSQANVLILNKG